jgi:hypothetical protein
MDHFHPCLSDVKEPPVVDLKFFHSEFSAYSSRIGRAEERTRTAYPCSLRVITQALQGCARACKCRISKGFSLLWVAACCTVLRSWWYQIGIRSTCSTESANPKKTSAACRFLSLQGVGYGLLKGHRPTLAPCLLPYFLSHAQAHSRNANVSLGEEVGISWNAFCFM